MRATRPPAGTADRALAHDYTEHEYLYHGVASTYSGPASGSIRVAHTGVDYTTRVLVRAPSDPTKFSGRVFLEPMNTSDGDDLDASWSVLAPLLQSEGDAWIGVTERYVSQTSLQTYDPVRYTALSLPSNDVAWDILRQVGAAVKAGGAISPLPQLKVRYLYMGAYSQSAIDVSTFAMAFSRRTGTASGAPVYDGFMPEGHDGSVLAVSSGKSALPPFENVPIRGVAVPLIDVETQTDVEGFSVPGYAIHGASTTDRGDSNTPGDLYHLWEVPGAAHASMFSSCAGGGTTFPLFYVEEAAFSALVDWTESGQVPAPAPRIVLAREGTPSVSKVDLVGNAVGGIRTPFLDEPLSRYAAHSAPGPICKLVGDETPLPVSYLTTRYKDVSGYLDAFTTALDAAVKGGFIRSQDRSEILAAQQAKATRAFA